MRSLRLSAVLPSAIFVLLVLVPSALRADWPPITKDDLAFKSVPGLPDAPAVILFHEEIDDDTLHYHQTYYRIKILTEAGRKYADVQLPFNKRWSTIADIKGRTTHADGSVVNFEGKPFDKEIIKDQTYKIHVKSVTLPDVQVGSVIEYQYSFRYDDDVVSSPEWVVQEDLFQKKVHFKFTPTRHQIVDESGTVSSGLAWSWNLPKNAEIKNVRDQYFELNMNDVEPFLDEEYMPPAQAFKFHVSFYYRWAARKEDFWKEKGKSWNKSVEKFIGKDAGVRDALATIIQSSDSAEQKARKIYAFIQTLDNTSYMPERNLEELRAAGLKFNTGVDDVLRQKRGNRDHITRLFVAMCRAAGLQANTMWVSDRSQHIFDENFLSSSQLDDEIAFVMIDGKEVALDPGTKFAPFGTLNWRYTGSQGFKQTGSGKVEIAKSPLPVVGIDAIQRAGNFALSDEGLANGTLLVRFYGQEALARRIRNISGDAAASKKMLEDEIHSWLPSNAEVSLTSSPNWADYEHPLACEFKISAPILSRAGKRVMLNSDFLVADRPAKFAHAQRRSVVYFHHSTREVDSIRISLPSSMAVENMTPSAAFNTPWAIYKNDRTREGNVISTNRDMALGGIVFGPEKYSELKGFFDKVKESDDQQILIRSTHAGQ